MQENITQSATSQPGDHLRLVVKYASFGGLFLSASSTFFVWAGSDTFNCPDAIWKTSLGINLILFALTWVAYVPFKNTDRLLGQGLLSIFMFISFFWMFGFSMFYFYFLFAPVSVIPRTIILAYVTSALAYRGYLIVGDIREAFHKHKNLLERIYCEDRRSFAYKRESFLLLQKARRDRNPFKSIHMYAAIIVAPFILVLNRVLTPFFGDGHGVFLVLAFFSVPILLWGVEIFAQTVVTMIYYPIKLERETGKPVLLKGW